ncbi:winged helix-turn-helix domain-containing protein [Shewanella pealeana]|uniref:Putative two component transcriptional regulator, winged helix family n=1 Tax=Shewanella pealeana (strain ATCC 700345 / ANG-SQ1) TaxID=398579 RepID=A8H864_SHEPA|nr:helix-turn-helix domain-containing protein [Shewanella pealeana]ABV88751.1 putative two component transcriptional regulator, winged helix family [Shewanella pealeana ATCC 700345]
MQLGHCRFDIDKQELTNLDSGDVWHLPRAEFQVLCLLIDYQGKVVAKPLLKKGDGEQAPLSDSSVTRAVFTLRSFLGPQYESLIETVKGQGYLLRHHRCRKEKYSSSDINRFSAKLLAGVAVVLLVIFSCGWIVYDSTRISVSTPVPLQSNKVKTISGHTVKVILYAHSKTNNGLLTELGQTMLQSFSQCKLTSWKNVYLSLSHDKQVLNVTLRGEQFGQSIIRNLKISDLRQPKQFINQQWLQGVDICD